MLDHARGVGRRLADCTRGQGPHQQLEAEHGVEGKQRHGRHPGGITLEGRCGLTLSTGRAIARGDGFGFEQARERHAESAGDLPQRRHRGTRFAALNLT